MSFNFAAQNYCFFCIYARVERKKRKEKSKNTEKSPKMDDFSLIQPLADVRLA